MAKKIVLILTVFISCLSIGSVSFAKNSSKQYYRIYMPFVEDSEEFDISDLDEGNIRAGWGCSLYVALACREDKPDGVTETGLGSLASLGDDEIVEKKAEWVAELPDGSVVKPCEKKDEGYVGFQIPFEMTGTMKVKASVNGEKVAEFDVTVVGKTKNGVKISGWRHSFNKWYYIQNDGKLVRNWLKKGSTWYYMNEEGVLQTGWQHLSYNGKQEWYYLSRNQNNLGKMLRGWTKVDGTWYYLRKDGTLASNEWYRGYWVSADGSWKYQPKGSWKHDKNGWWFGDTSGWYAKNEEMKINGVLYSFDARGYLVE